MGIPRTSGYELDSAGYAQFEYGNWYSCDEKRCAEANLNKIKKVENLVSMGRHPRQKLEPPMKSILKTDVQMSTPFFAGSSALHGKTVSNESFKDLFLTSKNS